MIRNEEIKFGLGCAIPVASVIIGPEKDFLVGALRRWRNECEKE